MAKYWTCPYCEAHLDHGERCSCREGKRRTTQKAPLPGRLCRMPPAESGARSRPHRRKISTPTAIGVPMAFRHHRQNILHTKYTICGAESQENTGFSPVFITC